MKNLWLLVDWMVLFWSQMPHCVHFVMGVKEDMPSHVCLYLPMGTGHVSRAPLPAAAACIVKFYLGRDRKSVV